MNILLLGSGGREHAIACKIAESKKLTQLYIAPGNAGTAGTPNLENETWVESANVINGTDTPQVASEKLQKGLDAWYKPAK